jgi:DNA-binding NarL/FixJ family response regulator
MKDSAPEQLVSALRKVAAGGRYLSVEVAEKLIGHLLADTDRPPHERLSDREFLILRLIATGRSTREISEALSLSVKTVATYRARIFEKMEMKNTSELTAYAVRHGLTD